MTTAVILKPNPPLLIRDLGNNLALQESRTVRDTPQIQPIQESRFRELETPGSSNVHSFRFSPGAERTAPGTLSVTFFGAAKAGGKIIRAGRGPTYNYLNVPPNTYALFRRRAGVSAGRAVWDYLRVRGSRTAHQYDYVKVGLQGIEIPIPSGGLPVELNPRKETAFQETTLQEFNPHHDKLGRFSGRGHGFPNILATGGGGLQPRQDSGPRKKPRGGKKSESQLSVDVATKDTGKEVEHTTKGAALALAALTPEASATIQSRVKAIRVIRPIDAMYAGYQGDNIGWEGIYDPYLKVTTESGSISSPSGHILISPDKSSLGTGGTAKRKEHVTWHECGHALDTELLSRMGTAKDTGYVEMHQVPRAESSSGWSYTKGKYGKMQEKMDDFARALGKRVADMQDSESPVEQHLAARVKHYTNLTRSSAGGSGELFAECFGILMACKKYNIPLNELVAVGVPGASSATTIARLAPGVLSYLQEFLKGEGWL